MTTKQGTILKFTGSSDDLIEVEIIHPGSGMVKHIEINIGDEDPTKILVQSIGGARGCYVFAHYDGCWHFSVRQLEEGRRIPNNWEYTIDQDDDVDNGYTVRLTIDAYRRAGELLDEPKRA